MYHSIMDNVGPLGLLIWLPLTLLLVFEVVMIIDAIKNKKLSDTEKVLWIVCIVLFNPIATLVYYFIASRRRLDRH